MATKKQIFGKPIITTIYAPTSQEKVKRLFMQWKKGGILKNKELNIITKKGKERTVLLSVNSMNDNSGNILNSISIQRDITERLKKEEEQKKLLHDYAERIKELECLYEMSNIILKSNNLEEALQGITDLLPSAWQHPEVTCARIIVDEQTFMTNNFKETCWKQSADIEVEGKRIGSVEVYYLEDRPKSNEGPFLYEEKRLINNIAQRTGRIIVKERMN